MNDRRTRTLAILAAAALGLLMVDRGYAALWAEPSKKLDEELERARLELVKARTIVAREDNVKAEWRRLRERMEKRPADVPNHFVSHLGKRAHPCRRTFVVRVAVVTGCLGTGGAPGLSS